MSGLETICLSLLSFINQQQAYPAVDSCPALRQVSRTILQRRACDGRPCPALAYYDRAGKTIYLLTSLDFGETLARGVLVHEMVHYVQDRTNSWEPAGEEDECRASLKRELDAFVIQERYLAHKQVYLPVSRNMMFYSC